MAAHQNPAEPFIILFILVILSHICNAFINHGSVLQSGETLYKYDTLRYGNYTLEFTYKCRLVLSDNGKQIWASNNRPTDEFCKCSFETFGNLVIKNLRAPFVLWTAFKSVPKEGRYVLVLQKDRNLVIYGSILWKAFNTKTVNQMLATNMITDSNNERYVLYDGETINPGESLKNGNYRLTMRKDCNLVLYASDKPVWSTKTADINNNCVCKLKSDGNLIVYKTWEVRPIWSAMEGRSWREEGHYALVLHGYGGLIIYDKPIWSTGTNIVKEMPAINGFASINGSA